MRILHTSDWHIGRTFHGYATLDALRGVLAVLADQVREHSVDAVLVSGDIFDSSTPSADCYTLLSDALRALADTGATVIVTSGNHDSAARLGFQSTLLRDGIHVVTDVASIGTPVTVNDADGPVHVYGIPYLEPALLRHRWDDARSHAAVLERAMSEVRADLAARGGRSVVMAHCFAAGVAPTPHLERDIQQGGLDVVPLSVFEGVDYAALGHIHGRQTLTETVRYSGAPLHYSFGEGAKPRGSWLIELDATGFAGATWLDLPVPRRVVTLRGSLDDLLTDPQFAADEDAWVCAIYTDTLPQRDPLSRLRQRFAHCAQVIHEPAERMQRAEVSYAQRLRATRTDREVLDAFLQHVREGAGANEHEAAVLDDVLETRTRAEAAR